MIPSSREMSVNPLTYASKDWDQLHWQNKMIVLHLGTKNSDELLWPLSDYIPVNQ
jgi:hypothetical protein